METIALASGIKTVEVKTLDVTVDIKSFLSLLVTSKHETQLKTNLK